MSGSPGALVAIGLGVFLIAVAYLDKVKEVWTAASSGTGFAAHPLSSDPNQQADTADCVTVTVEAGQPGGSRSVCVPPDSIRPATGDQCSPAHTRVRVGGALYCASKIVEAAGGQSYESISLGSTGAWRRVPSGSANWFAEISA